MNWVLTGSGVICDIYLVRLLNSDGLHSLGQGSGARH